ncbi:MAG: LPS assembly protein LptD [Gammaproteobacteria bacterium]|nr:LPS assembly protein LptD [Gammaproteobacteria bacterium]
MQATQPTANTRPRPAIESIGSLTPLARCLRNLLPAGVAALLMTPAVAVGAPAWDCRMAADGVNWECVNHGDPVDEAAPDTAPAAASEVTPIPSSAEDAAGPLTPAGASTKPVASEAPTVAEPEAAEAAMPVPPAAPATPTPARRLPDAFVREQPVPPAAPVEAAEPAVTTAPARMPAATRAFQSEGMPQLTPPAAAATTAVAADPAVAPQPPEQTAVTEPVADQRAGVPGATFAGALDAGIAWGTCPSPNTGRPLRPTRLSPTPATGDRSIEITADTVTAQLDPQQAVFSGNVHLVQDGVNLDASEVTLDRSSGRIQARGGFLLTQPDIRFAGQSVDYQLETRAARVDRASYRIPAIRARGDAERAAFLGDGISEFDQISYTTCAPDDASWLLTAGSLRLDQNEGFGVASNASLRFMGVPILYMPTFTFPIDDRRRSGVLVPSVGYSGNTGVDVSVPYYLNLAENYDLTLTPRAMSKRGLMLGGEFRFLTETTAGTLAADYLPDDREQRDRSGGRGSASLYSHSQFNARTEGALRINYVSDDEYFQDLGGSLAVTSATHVERTGELRYHGDTWDLLGRAQYFQTLDDAILDVDRPYSRLPQVRFDLERPDGIAGLSYHLGAEYVNFHRNDSVRGHRVDLTPAVSLPLGDSWWFAEPRVGAHFTTYRLTDQVAGLDDSPSHLTGLLSLDSGLYFDRAISYFGNSATQTLEPRLFYLYVPSSEQNDQPLFDTAELDFSFDNLFRDNRFSGPDRVADANQLTLALTTRVTDDARGGELLRASIGQILHFEDRDVTLPGRAAIDDSTSSLVAELAARLGGDWYSRAGLQWDPHDGKQGTIEQALAQISYRDDRRRVFNAAYRLRDGVTKQTDLAFLWPVSESLSLIGRHYWSLQDDRLLEALAGVEYGTCCWRVRAVARKYTDSTGDDHNLAFLLQLELSGLGRLGNDIDSTLERGVYGYRTDYED